MTPDTIISIAIYLASGAALWILLRRPPKPTKENYPNRTPNGPQTATQAATRPPVRDCKPGTDRAALDWMEQVYAMPCFQRSTDRLLDDIHNDNGDQQA